MKKQNVIISIIIIVTCISGIFTINFNTRNILKIQSDSIYKQVYSKTDNVLKKIEEENEKRKCQILVSDIDMPGMSGIETFEQMKDMGVRVPVIFLTASGLEEDVVNAIRLGAVNYLKKPFRPQELMKRVSQEFAKQ